MAKFNGNIYGNLAKNEQRDEILKAMPMIQEMLSTEDYIRLVSEYDKSSDVEWYKYVFERIEIKLIE